MKIPLLCVSYLVPVLNYVYRLNTGFFVGISRGQYKDWTPTRIPDVSTFVGKDYGRCSKGLLLSRSSLGEW